MCGTGVDDSSWVQSSVVIHKAGKLIAHKCNLNPIKFKVLLKKKNNLNPICMDFKDAKIKNFTFIICIMYWLFYQGFDAETEL